MTDRIVKFGLKVDKVLADFIDNSALDGLQITSKEFWLGFSNLISELAPKNKNLLQKREHLQSQIDTWHIENRGTSLDIKDYESFLRKIGYLVNEGTPFQITTENVDPEISKISGPQLVVPVMNARYALNAANARWGSLYDAYYGTDAIGDLPKGETFDQERGARVIEAAKSHLDSCFPIKGANWSEISLIQIIEGKLVLQKNGELKELEHAKQFKGYIEDEDKILSEVVFEKNQLHIRVIIDPSHRIGKIDPAHISDILLESAISTIMDCEDSVAAVDGEDKVLAYKNWLGLMKGDLTEDLVKSGKSITRSLNPDLEITSPAGTNVLLKGRSLMLNRNVGHLMSTPAVLDSEGSEIPEGLLDAMCTILIAMHDLKKTSGIRNSIEGSIYIVKPKLHGPEEVLFTDEIFAKIEETLRLPVNTVKIGIMDEERRTSVNLMECIRAAKARVAFINTGFLDRTGDEIHTSMEAGPFLRKGDMKDTPWIHSYENRNVNIGLSCGLKGRAQIGKGMWAMPDLMKDMLEQKINHPLAGANCAWVPSPTAATLHSMHYHLINVVEVQENLLKTPKAGSLSDLLTIPTNRGENWSPDQINEEVENNCQGILGYVVRWVDQGIGCSKVPNVHDVGLMEDRATCRISAQALANWIHHGIVSKDNVLQAMKKMAKVVDRQNAADSAYSAMSEDYNGSAFKAACDLVILGKEQPSGYTEPVLHIRRQELKLSLHA